MGAKVTPEQIFASAVTDGKANDRTDAKQNGKTSAGRNVGETAGRNVGEAAVSEKRPAVSDEQVRSLLLTYRDGPSFASADAFTTLSTLYAPLLHTITDSFKQDPAFADTDCEDLLQEASIVLLRAARSYDLEQKNVTFGLYLKICLRNAFISLLRHKRSEQRAKKAAERGRLRTAPGAYSPEQDPTSHGAGMNSDSAFLTLRESRSARRSKRSEEDTALIRLAKLFRPPEALTETADAAKSGDETTPMPIPVPMPMPAKPAALFPRTPSLQMLREELIPMLTPFEREVFLRFYAGMSYEQIAVELSHSVKSVDNALFRIRKKWRRHFWTSPEESSGNAGKQGSE